MSVIDAIWLNFGYREAAAELLGGTLKLRHSCTQDSQRFPVPLASDSSPPYGYGGW